MIDELGGLLPSHDQQRLLKAAGTQAKYWPTVSGCEQRAFMLHIVASVTVAEQEVRIVLRRDTLRHFLLGDAPSTHMATAAWGNGQAGLSASDSELAMRVPARHKLCSGKMRLVIPPRDGGTFRPRPNSALIKALTRAHNWKDRLVSGEALSLRAVAKEDGVTHRYVGRILPLPFLAPDIVEAILDGYQPLDLELDRFLKGIPLAWEDQRKLLGFSRT